MTTRVEEITAEFRRRASVANGIEQRLAAHFSLHRAACLNRDNQEIQQRRDELHTVLDALLDNWEAVQSLIAELQELQAQP
jgi:predicted  nucleic acid-binding Zn-ribbon protein